METYYLGPTKKRFSSGRKQASGFQTKWTPISPIPI